jgi:hypothetical protein
MAFRTDGLDNHLSPNGPHPLYYVEEESGRRHGPYSCLTEAVNATDDEFATITAGNTTYAMDQSGHFVEQ